MKSAYIYPISARVSKISNNSYINDLINSFADKIHFINANHPSYYGIFDLITYCRKIDIIFLNWVEDLPDKKGGLLQSIFLITLLSFLRIRKVKIFYTIHNKESHVSKNLYFKKLLRRILYKFSDYILTHSSAGLEILPNIEVQKKARYIPHPFAVNSPPKIMAENKKEYDALIWGAIKPYKGIDKFLHYMETDSILNKYHILIAGKIDPKGYEDQILRYKSQNKIIINEFIDNDTLNMYIRSSRIVLFTYNENSILSSGALVYSLSQLALVVGPNTGAFRDLKNLGLIEVFDNYYEIADKMILIFQNGSDYRRKIAAFISNNTWEKFSKVLSDWMDQ
jgi:beta-1,4-mannosyltransferase